MEEAASDARADSADRTAEAAVDPVGAAIRADLAAAVTDPAGHHRSADITASCSAGRICWMAVFSRVGFTRLVRNTTYRSRSGSTHNEVPVNPV